MDINITRVSVEAQIRCAHCGNTDHITVDDGDTYFSESQMVDAVIERLSDEGWDGDMCEECVYNRDNPDDDGEEEDN
jgi:hypothetical protein